MNNHCKIQSLPFTIAVDTRERKPYQFRAIPGEMRGTMMIIPAEIVTITTGDYSIIGHLQHVAVERKSLRDLYSTLSKGRARFERELQRLSVIPSAIVLVEAELSTVLNSPPKHAKLSPKNVYRTILSYSIKYPVRWLFLPDRRSAEITCIRLLQKYWKHKLTIGNPDATRDKRA